ncbi:MAG: carbon-nitrogen hydrolase [Gammaproteobacteria bacterium]|nr:carbon-nitrogen hydrolase [Gammaproteobacteria bacterium]
MSAKKIKVGLVQHACTDDPDANLAASIAGIQQAADQGTQLVLLQELHRSSYFCQTEDTANFDLAEPVPGPTTRRLGELAAELRLVIIASLFEKRSAGLYHNTAVVLDVDGSIAGCYRKMHIPDDPGYHEKFYFTPGDLGFQPVTTSLGKLGVLVCWDQWYPEAARLMALAGAELLLYPTAIGWDSSDTADEQARQREAWVTVQRGHAISNCLPVLACNRIGHEADFSGQTGGIQFWGSSCVIGAQGEVLAQAATDQAETLLAELDLGRTEQLRRTWPFLRDRRIDAYQGLLDRFRD